MAEMRSLVCRPAGLPGVGEDGSGHGVTRNRVVWFRERMQADFLALGRCAVRPVEPGVPGAGGDTIQNLLFYMDPVFDKRGVENQIYINPKMLGDNVLPYLWHHEGSCRHL